MRRHYVTLCVHGNTIVTFMKTDDDIEVTFEQAKYNGFNTTVMSLDGKILNNSGFEPAEIDYFQRFLARNRAGIAEEAMGNA